MTDHRPTRRDIMRPVQLLGFGFGAAAFSGIITLVSMGFFQDLTGPERAHVIIVSLVVAGIAFIVTLVVIALLMLAVDPAQIAKPVGQGVLLPPHDEASGEGASGDQASGDHASGDQASGDRASRDEGDAETDAWASDPRA